MRKVTDIRWSNDGAVYVLTPASDRHPPCGARSCMQMPCQKACVAPPRRQECHPNRRNKAGCKRKRAKTRGSRRLKVSGFEKTCPTGMDRNPLLPCVGRKSGLEGNFVLQASNLTNRRVIQSPMRTPEPEIHAKFTKWPFRSGSVF